MTRTLIAACLLLSLPAHAAEVLMEARPPNGAIIQLHEAFGPCVDGARTATWVAPGGVNTIPGCYKIDPDENKVSIAWFDGDGSALRLSFFKKPTGI